MSSATYPEPGYRCVKWSNDTDLASGVNAIQVKSKLILAGSVSYLVFGAIALMMMKQDGIRFALPLVVSGAIAMGTSIPLTNFNDTSKVYDQKTLDLLNVGAGSLLAPLLTFLVYYLGSAMGNAVTQNTRVARYSRFRGDHAF